MRRTCTRPSRPTATWRAPQALRLACMAGCALSGCCAAWASRVALLPRSAPRRFCLEAGPCGLRAHACQRAGQPPCAAPCLLVLVLAIPGRAATGSEEDLQVSHALEGIAADTSQPALDGCSAQPSSRSCARGDNAQRARARAAAPQAALGGDPTRLGEVKAYLRVRERDAALDFDAPGGGGVDTSWQRVFLCLRSGFGQEALQARRAAPAGAPGVVPRSTLAPGRGAGRAPVRHFNGVPWRASVMPALHCSAVPGPASQACAASALSSEAARLAPGREPPHDGARRRTPSRRRACAPGTHQPPGRRRAGGAGAARRRGLLARAGGVGARRHRGRPAVGHADRAAPPRPLHGVVSLR